MSADWVSMNENEAPHESRNLSLSDRTAFHLGARILILLILASACGFGAWRAIFHETAHERGLAALRKVYKSSRPVEARITALDKYAPFLQTRGEDAGLIDETAHRRAELLLLDAVETSPGSGSSHALGVAYLADGRIDDAVGMLETSVNSQPKDAAIHSDLAAAYFERAKATAHTPSIVDAAKSLEHAGQSIKLDGSLLSAQFNRALCLQRMNLTTLAREAWQDYLKRDAHSDWSKEAAQNLQVVIDGGAGEKTSDEVTRDFLAAYQRGDESGAWRIESQTKETITGAMVPFQLIRRCLAAETTHSREAGDYLGALRFVGELERRRTGDPFFVDLAAFYRAKAKTGYQLLSRAEDSLQRGYRLCLEGRYSEAAAPFESARSQFFEGGDVYEARTTDYWVAYCLAQNGKPKEGLNKLAALASYCSVDGYLWLESQAYSGMATDYAVLGEHSQGIDYDRKALAIASAAGDLYQVQKSSCQLADDYKLFDRFDEALGFNRQSLPARDAYFVSQRQLWRNLSSTVETLYALQLYSAAESFQKEALARNRARDPVLTHNAYLRLGQIFASEENFAEAEQYLGLSMEALNRNAADPAVKRLLGESLEQMGDIRKREGDPSGALNYYEHALEAFRAGGFSIYDYETHKKMLMCDLENNDCSAVEKELPIVLNLFEQNRGVIREEQNRNHFFDVEQDVYDLAIEYEYSRGDAMKAFNYAEFSKARSLLDAVVGGTTAVTDPVGNDIAISASSTPLILSQVVALLKRGQQVVEYAVLRDRLLVWVVTNEGWKLTEQAISAVELQSLVSRYLLALANAEASLRQERELSTRLHDVLFASLETSLNRGGEIAVVPDKFLFKVPFVALLSGTAGRRIIEDYTLLYAPSASVLVHCSDLARQKARRLSDENLLSVSDPSFDVRQHRGLSRLPSAAFEGSAVARFYQNATVLAGADARKALITKVLARANVIQFATHYLTDGFSVRNSRLLLAASPQSTAGPEDNDLSLPDIQTSRLPRAKLVVLSACRSGIEQYYAGEGLVGLSRAFIEAGVPLVVGSQWPVDSDPTAGLMVNFHRLRRTQGLRTTKALRDAQRGMLMGQDERFRLPFYWAAFFAIGGFAPY